VLDEKFSVTEMFPIELSRIRPSRYVGIASMPQADGMLRTLEVLVFPEAARGAGEDHTPGDLQPGSLTTIATVAEVASARMAAAQAALQGRREDYRGASRCFGGHLQARTATACAGREGADDATVARWSADCEIEALTRGVAMQGQAHASTLPYARCRRCRTGSSRTRPKPICWPTAMRDSASSIWRCARISRFPHEPAPALGFMPSIPTTPRSASPKKKPQVWRLRQLFRPHSHLATGS
jgi:hypothetical protein